MPLYEVTRTFQFQHGGMPLTLVEGTLVSYDGDVCRCFGGVTFQTTLLRGAIQSGWLVLTDAASPMEKDLADSTPDTRYTLLLEDWLEAPC